MRSMTSFLPLAHHCATSWGSVNARHTRSRGASNTRSIRISRFVGVVTFAASSVLFMMVSPCYA